MSEIGNEHRQRPAVIGLEHVEELEAKLARALKGLDKIQFGYYGRAAAIARTTIAELTGGKDE